MKPTESNVTLVIKTWKRRKKSSSNLFIVFFSGHAIVAHLFPKKVDFCVCVFVAAFCLHFDTLLSSVNNVQSINMWQISSRSRTQPNWYVTHHTIFGEIEKMAVRALFMTAMIVIFTTIKIQHTHASRIRKNKSDVRSCVVKEAHGCNCLLYGEHQVSS